MQRITAELLIPGSGEPVRDGVVVLDGAWACATIIEDMLAHLDAVPGYAGQAGGGLTRHGRPAAAYPTAIAKTCSAAL